jgi:hypothetical protein
VPVPPARHLAPARGAGSASHHRAPPSRSVLGLLAAGLLLVLSLVLVVAPMALADEEDGADVGATNTGATDTGGSSGLDGTGALAGDFGPGGYADGWGSSPSPGGSPPPGESTGSPSWAGGPAPTQHNGIRRVPRASQPVFLVPPPRVASPTWTPSEGSFAVQPQGQVATPGRLATTRPSRSEPTARVWLPSWRRRPEFARGGAPPVREGWLIVVASTASFLTRAGRDRLGRQRVRHVGGDTGIGQQIREPAPPVGGFEHDLDRSGLELAEEAQELRGCVADPPGQHDLTRGIQGDHV